MRILADYKQVRMLLGAVLLGSLMWSGPVCAQPGSCATFTPCVLEPFWATTFNTYLLGFPEFPGSTPTAPFRRAVLIDALKQSDSDIICLNEVWDCSDVSAIATGVIAEFPYSFSQIHNADGTLPAVKPEPPCDTVKLLDLQACATFSGCPPFQPGMTYQQRIVIATCIITQCQPFFLDLIANGGGQTCLTCILYTINALEQCTINGDPAVRYIPNFGGSMILSKKPLTDMTYTDYYFFANVKIITRGYLKVKFDNQIDVLCTHLSTGSADFYPEPELSQNFNNYEEQNAFEVSHLRAQFGCVKPLLLLGDMNTGLAFSEGIDSKFPTHYQLLKAAFPSTTPTPTCTLCDGTQNIFNPEDGPNTIIDHILANGLYVKNTRRIFTEDDYTVLVNGDIVVSLSDHFGSTSRIICDPGQCRRRPLA